MAGWFTISAQAADSPTFLTGSEFQQQINRPLLVNRDLTPLREFLERLSEERRVAIVIDRRIDPDQLVAVDLQSPYFDTGIEELVRPFGGMTLIANSVFVTLPDTAKTLQTRVILAEQALEEVLKKDLGRKLDLSRRKSISWNFAASPRDILTNIATGYRITIENPDAIPYDQWAAGRIPAANAVEGLMLIATQFNCDLQWIDSTRVRLIPEAPSPQVTIEHTLRKMTSQQGLNLIRERFPDIQVETRRDRLLVTGLHEQQQEIGVLLGNRAGRTRPVSPKSTPLTSRRFTLRMQNRPFIELVQVFEKQGVQVQRDNTALEEAGVDLNTKISLELENATIYRLLDDACRPLGLSYRVDGARIELRLPEEPVNGNPLDSSLQK